MSFITRPVSIIFHHRKILNATTYQEIKKKYAGSILGYAWIFLYPLLFLCVYACVYAFILKVSYPGLTVIEYICVIFSGLLLYFGFSEALTASTSSIIANAGLIKNTLFPIELVPVRTVFCSQMTQGAGLIILSIATAVIGTTSVYTPLIIVIWFLELLMELGFAWILSSITVYLRDMQNVISIIMMLIMMASPIAYPASAVPEALKVIAMFNPIYCFVVSGQKVMVFGQLPDVTEWIGMLLWGILTPIIGFFIFDRLKGVFVDNV